MSVISNKPIPNKDRHPNIGARCLLRVISNRGEDEKSREKLSQGAVIMPSIMPKGEDPSPTSMEKSGENISDPIEMYLQRLCP